MFNPNSMSKRIKDPIHGWIKLDPLLVSVLDTPQVQRLRRVKQLALVELVFPGASHNRLAHSIGVSFLGGETMRTLQKEQPKLNISDRDIVLVELAGLCHDLGHGPFSHTFDHEVLPSIGNTDLPPDHEDRSREILEYVVKQYDIDIRNHELEIVLEMIHPHKDVVRRRPYMYEIIANSTSGVDVDKFDYLMRDTFYLGWKTCFDAMAFVKNVRVIDGHICYPDWLVTELQQMFMTRYQLHKSVYNNKVVKAMEYMTADVLVHADPVIGFSKRPNDWVLHSDSILDLIRFSTDPKLQYSQSILKRIDERDLYKCIHHEVLALNRKPVLPYVSKTDIVQDIRQGFVSGRSGHPMPKVFFYNSKEPNRKFRVNIIKVSRILDTCHQERLFRIFRRQRRNKIPWVLHGQVTQPGIDMDVVIDRDVDQIFQPYQVVNSFLTLHDSSTLNMSSRYLSFTRDKVHQELIQRYLTSMHGVWKSEYLDWIGKCCKARTYVEGRIIIWMQKYGKEYVQDLCEAPSEIAIEYADNSKLDEVITFLDMLHLNHDVVFEEIWKFGISNRDFLSEMSTTKFNEKMATFVRLGIDKLLEKKIF